MRINLKKKTTSMLLMFVIVAFLFWFLFMRKREGFLEGVARKAKVASQTKGVIAKATNKVIKVSNLPKIVRNKNP